MSDGRDKNIDDNLNLHDKCINLFQERASDYPISQYGAYGTHTYYPFPPQHHGFRPYPQRAGGYPPSSYPLPGYSFPSYSDPLITGGDHPWGSYHEGGDSGSMRRTERKVDNDSEGSMKNEDKKGQLRWNTSMDDILFDILGDAAREGKKKGKEWDTSVLNDLIATLSKKTTEPVKSSHIENRLRQMKTDYYNFMALKRKSGTSYDRVKQLIVAPEGFWIDLLSTSGSLLY